ncbi:transcription termination factor Rho [Leucobacter exalbidus]|uniref:Transcription termination factor Rho n=1 Tax=Leucobacter exalbidus TaxID=662960 RepID=A0A940T086_9MICO|nr:transcription termination factor Rho [Leucobacter exalbidus]
MEDNVIEPQASVGGDATAAVAAEKPVRKRASRRVTAPAGEAVAPVTVVAPAAAAVAAPAAAVAAEAPAADAAPAAVEAPKKRVTRARKKPVTAEAAAEAPAAAESSAAAPKAAAETAAPAAESPAAEAAVEAPKKRVTRARKKPVEAPAAEAVEPPAAEAPAAEAAPEAAAEAPVEAAADETAAAEAPVKRTRRARVSKAAKAAEPIAETPEAETAAPAETAASQPVASESSETPAADQAAEATSAEQADADKTNADQAEGERPTRGRTRGRRGQRPETAETAEAAQPEAAAAETKTQGQNQAQGAAQNQGQAQNQNQNQAQNQNQNQAQANKNQRGQKTGESQNGPESNRHNDKNAESRSSRTRQRDRKRRGQGDDIDPEITEDDVLLPIAGILDVLDNYAFVRTSGYLPGTSDVYVSLGQVKKYGLKRGDAVVGAIRQPREGDQAGRQKYNAIVKVDSINGRAIEENEQRAEFSELSAIYPVRQLPLSTGAGIGSEIDAAAPVGFGQRGLLVVPQPARGIEVLSQLAASVSQNAPDAHLMLLLTNAQPEDITHLTRTVNGEVIAASFERTAEDQATIAELGIERAKRLAELGHDVVVLIDSVGDLARAYAQAQPVSSRPANGAVDEFATAQVRRVLGAARNVENGGSVTVLATAAAKTGFAADKQLLRDLRPVANCEIRFAATAPAAVTVVAERSHTRGAAVLQTTSAA